MPCFQSKAIAGALALAGMIFAPPRICAQTPVTVKATVAVQDSRGSALPGATVTNAAGQLLGRTGSDGRLTLDCALPCPVRVAAEGFSEKLLQLTGDVAIRLDPAAPTEQVTVTAYRTPLSALESPATTRILSQVALNSTASITLDGKLRQLPGIELFRRSSSLVANPSSQGISLRGLGSTSASRTLVTEDDVPLNDPIGGWIHWQEQPQLSIQRIELVRGGASDLYGSSAIGGVVNIVSARPTTNSAQLRSSYGSEATFDDSLLLQAARAHWGLLAAGGLIGTNGYIQQAPWQRGPVDIASSVHSHNAMLLAEHTRGPLRLFLRGSGFNEARGNGTPDQTNGTRIWRYATGADWQAPNGGSLIARLYGSTGHYRQTFSQIANPTTSRNSETATKLSLMPSNELGAAIHWSQPLGPHLLLLAGADLRDVRIWDREQSYVSSPALTNLHDHQRDSAAYAELMWIRNAWTLAASSRIDWFRNFDGRKLAWTGAAWTPTATQPPQFDQRVFDPRLGLSRKLGDHFALSASAFRAFRAPTPNELYRATQVGNKLTNPNAALLSERATGWEAGLAGKWLWGTIRSSYFLTQVNRPIVAVTTCSTCSPILLQRENLGQIESRGLALDFELEPLHWLTLDGGYQFARATVTRGNQDLANWIPEVARNMATANLRATRPRIGTLNLQTRLSGRQFDDDANAFMLHGYLRLDAFASHDFGSRLQLFAAGENLFNRQIEVSKTPTTTLAMPTVARFGFLIRLGSERHWPRPPR